MVLPLDRLRELAEQKFIDSVADYHYSFMGATDPTAMETEARNMANLLKQDRVNGVLLWCRSDPTARAPLAGSRIFLRMKKLVPPRSV